MVLQPHFRKFPKETVYTENPLGTAIMFKVEMSRSIVFRVSTKSRLFPDFLGWGRGAYVTLNIAFPKREYMGMHILK